MSMKTVMKQAGLALESSGHALDNAADGAKTIAGALKASGPAATAFKDLASITKSIEGILAKIVVPLRKIEEGFRSVEIPGISVTKKKFDLPFVGEVELVTKVRLITRQPLKFLAARFKKMADEIDNIRERLLSARDQIFELKNACVTLSGQIKGVGTDLGTAANYVEKSGDKLKEVAGLVGAGTPFPPQRIRG